MSGDAPALSCTCARCGAAFHCGVKDDAPCWCSQVKLSAQTLAALEKQYRTCLCSTCLTALQAKEGE